MRRSLLSRIYTRAFTIPNWFVPWHRLLKFLGVLNLGAIREVLRAQNLHDTSKIPETGEVSLKPPEIKPLFLYSRESDGYYNDLDNPKMGSAGARFGRNVPLEHAYPEKEPGLLQPSPRTISCRLLARKTFIPAETLNLLAAAWIQFQTHDWFFHGEPPSGNEIKIPLETGDDWHEKPMRIRRTLADPTRSPDDDKGPPTYINAESHWWDGSQIYGSDDRTMARLRSKRDGKLILDGDLLSLDDMTKTELTGFTGNWWIGLSLLHTLFTREHNAICDRLRLEYPQWSDDHLFHTARLVNVALMAKIHTIEWTLAILAHPALKIGMNANWWGLATEGIKKLFGRISQYEAISGIPGSSVNHHGADYALTEEFVSVYRMHPLMPDDFKLHSASDGRLLKEFLFPDVVGDDARSHVLAHGTMTDVFYSFGIAHPGAITLRNYPSFLRKLQRKDGEIIDLAAVDIMRDRERGVPRYNEFRKLLHLPPVKSFEKLTKDPELAKEICEVYDGDMNRVDLMVGMYAETPPKGFGFSDTAFRIFILMASRRLKSDRFFTTDYTPEVYTQTGLDWVDENTMSTVLLRHFPGLRPSLCQVDNAFKPWPRLKTPRRITIPFLLDVVIVKDVAHMRELNNNPHISRVISRSGGFIHKMLQARIYKTLSVRNTPLPVFTGREDSAREDRQKRLETQFREKVERGKLAQADDIRKLADYVAGHDQDVHVGVTVQQIVGRFFISEYTATPRTYEDAKVIDKWLRGNPFTALKLRLTGELRRAKRRLWEKANHDTYCIHATAIAVHNIVEAINNMRRLAKYSKDRSKWNTKEVVSKCLVAPSTLIRSCVKETYVPFFKEPLKKGTLIIFQLQKMHAGTGDTDLAFLKDEWSECPAHAIVPCLLEEVWKASL